MFLILKHIRSCADSDILFSIDSFHLVIFFSARWCMQILEILQPGDKVDIKGPLGTIVYNSPGAYMHAGRQCSVSRINMVAGGTGITPMYQVISAILGNQSDTTELRLVYANHSEEDILLRKEFDSLAALHPKRFKIHYTISEAGAGWKYSVGFVSLEMLQRHLFEADKGTVTFLCGPPLMLKIACHPNLEKMGFVRGSTSIEF